MPLGPFSKQDHMQITSLGMEFAVAEILGAAFGFWLDKKWGTTPWMLLVGVVCGFALGFYMIWRAAKEMEKQTALSKEIKKDGRS